MAGEEQFPADWLTYDRSQYPAWKKFTADYSRTGAEWFVEVNFCRHAAETGHPVAAAQWTAWRQYLALQALKGGV